MEIGIAVLDYLTNIKHLRHGSQKLYQQHLGVFAQWCEEQHITLEKVNNRAMQGFLVFLLESHTSNKRGREKLSSYTVANYHRSIKAFLHWCLEDEEYSSCLKLQTVKGMKPPHTEAIIKDTFTDEEIETLFNACQHPSKMHEYQLRDTAILAVLLDTGVRAEELRTLTVGHVTLARESREDSYIRVMGKGHKEREIPLGNKSRRTLGRYIRECRKGARKSEVVFLSRRAGTLTHEALRDTLARLAKLVELPVVRVNPHKFRHTFATRFMAAGGDVYDLSRLMGHSSVAITENYLRTLSARAVRQRKTPLSVLDSL